MNKKFGIIAILIVLVGAIGGGLFGKFTTSSSADNSLTPEKIVGDYRQALDVIDESYVGKVDHEKISESSIQGMLWTLDPHSSFFTRDEFRKLYEDQQSQFYGIGVSILQHRDGVYVQSVIPNTPADKAGVRYGDRFVTIDGKEAKEMSSSEVSKNVRGERGTSVNVKLERAGSNQPVDLTITRGGVPLPSIRNYFMLPNSVGYVGLNGGFQETTAAELDEAVSSLREKGMKNLVLDLRGNPGGLLPQAIEVVSRFVDRGQTVVSVKGRSQYSESRELKTIGGKYDDFPVVVMINGGSASASEIVAGALQDYGRGVIVGTDSFGKGLVQRVFPLPYQTGLTLTTARYYTPFGRSLQRDYSSGSIYDYYTHGEESEDENAASTEENSKPQGVPVKTAFGRILYGGRGIEPDLKVTPMAYTPVRGRIGEAAFFFARQLTAGTIGGFENLKTGKQNYLMTVQNGEFQISDKLYEAFVQYTVANKENGLSAENIASQKDFAKSRLRAELATANNSSEAGQQVLLETDPQVLKAIDALPEAKKYLERNLANK